MNALVLLLDAEIFCVYLDILLSVNLAGDSFPLHSDQTAHHFRFFFLVSI